MLQAAHGRVVDPGHVMRHLAGRMGIHAQTQAMHIGIDGRLVALHQHQVAQVRVLLGRQHVAVGKDETVDGVVRDVVPVDQLIKHIFIGAKRQDVRHHLHGYTLLFRQPFPLPRLLNGLPRIRLELG
ncbi:hypothetical protein D3C81_1785360 [compost metagenome]